MRLFDADDIIARMPNNLPYKASVRRVLMQAEEIDAVPVVYCRYCKFCNPKTTHCDHVMGTQLDFTREPYDFCSYGERRADNGE